MSEKIKEIRFLNFRGLPDYSCPLKGKSLAVLAGNGKGKSGIVDGIEFLFAGRVRRFYGEGTGSINPDEAIRHIQRKGEPLVELHFTPTNDCVRRLLSQASCDPRAFLSEGHLDSLGLCLFLATVRTFNTPGTLLVLDDVLTSIDKDHRHRVAELLLEEFGDFQLVLTTHDEHWFGILQSKAQARGDQGQWLFKRIVRWTVDLGP